MERSWDILETYRGRLFEGDWPSISTMFSITVERHAQRKSFTTLGANGKTFTYGQLNEEILRVAAYMQEQGVGKGDRVLLNGKNSPAWAIGYLATLFCGAVIVPLDNQMQAERVNALGSFAGASFMLADSDVIVACKRDQWFESLKGAISLDGQHETGKPDIYSARAGKGFKVVKTDEHDLAAILFTSGTTGNEKGVMLSHRNIVSDVYQAGDREFLTITETDVFYALLPLHHSYSMTAVFLVALMYGCEIIFGQGMVVSRILSDMREGKVTMFLAIPLLYNKLLAGLFRKVREKGLAAYVVVRSLLFVNGLIRTLTGKNPGRRWFHAMLEGIGMTNIRICISGGGPLSPKTFRRYQQLGIDFIQGYGLTETAPILTLNPVSRFKVASVGKVFPLVKMRIGEADLFGVGEVQVQGPNICLGYYRDPVNTGALFTADGWLKTGDLGSLDKDNYLYLKGRAKNIIVTEGGKNVYPEEIEDAFQLYGQIEQVLVRGYLAKKAVKAEGIEAVIHPNAEHYRNLGFNNAAIEQDIARIVTEVNRKMRHSMKISRVTLVEKPMAMTSTRKIQRGKVSRTSGKVLDF